MTDFFDKAQANLKRLNETERTLFDYVVKNMSKVKRMSIQKFAAEQFLSTTTIFRFAQKLGFSGYNDFIECLLITDSRTQSSEIPDVLHKKAYGEEYLKNMIEAFRVMSTDRMDRVREVLRGRPPVYILADGHSADIGRYVERLFIGIGLRSYFPEADYQVASLMDSIDDGDLLIAMSFSGQSAFVIGLIERIMSKKRPFLLSLTRADNNVIQNMSDVNFYVFADKLELRGVDLTSRLSMLMILELLVYDYIIQDDVTKFTTK